MSSQPPIAPAVMLNIFTTIAGDLQRVEAAIEEALVTDVPLLQEVSTHLLHAGGKRIRPALLLLTAKFPGVAIERVLPVAAAVEMIHMASLVHDDVVDDSRVRRGRPTVNAQWSNQISVLTGDYLFAKAFAMLGQTGNTRVVEIMANTVYEISKGELAQIASYFDVNQSEAAYYERIAQKTGYLLAECSRLGGVIAEVPEEQVQALFDYGMGVGLSFQIADDLLDFHGSAKTVGKPVCGDLKLGILTLPVIYALANSADAEELRGIILTRSVGDQEIERVKEILTECGAFEYARQQADEHLARAQAALDRVPALETREALRELAHFVINRSF